ncbi:MAG: hypothetical protein WB816_19435 [Methylocystis sp.]
MPINENSSAAAAALQSNPIAGFILPNDELQTFTLGLRVTRFAEIQGNGHFHAYGDAIRSVDRGADVPQNRIKARYGKMTTGIKIL